MKLITDKGNTSVSIKFTHKNGVFNKDTKTFVPEKQRTTIATAHIVSRKSGEEKHITANSGILYFKDTFNKSFGRYKSLQKLMLKLNTSGVLSKEDRRALWKQFFATSPKFEKIFNTIDNKKADKVKRVTIAL